MLCSKQLQSSYPTQHESTATTEPCGGSIHWNHKADGAPRAQEMRLYHVSLVQGKTQIKTQLLLNACHFGTIRKVKILALNRHKLGTICVSEFRPSQHRLHFCQLYVQTRDQLKVPGRICMSQSKVQLFKSSYCLHLFFFFSNCRGFYTYEQSILVKWEKAAEE